jgi:hypothetical protein
MNKGLPGSEYSRFRIGGATIDSGASAYIPSIMSNGWVVGWRGVTITKHNSIYLDDSDSAIIDSYFNYYWTTYTSDI